MARSSRLVVKKITPGHLVAGRFVPNRSKNLFGFGKKRAGYMVLDRDGYPVHTGRDLPKREALEVAKEARRHGERVRLVKSNPPLPKLGSGKRFEACVKAVSARGGAYDPDAVCASRGIRKYGKKKMAKLARAGKKRAARRRSR
jgi:hypothetical protein